MAELEQDTPELGGVFDNLGMLCPSCRRDDGIRIEATVTLVLGEDGTDTEGDHEWGDFNRAWCVSCHRFEGTVADFKPKEQADV